MRERTSSGRIIIGGEDSEDIIEPEARDGMIPEKSRMLTRKARGIMADRRSRHRILLGRDLRHHQRWPALDRSRCPARKGVYAAYGYGGNGITFSFLAAQLIGDLIAGSSSPLLGDFALDRDGRSPV